MFAQQALVFCENIPTLINHRSSFCASLIDVKKQRRLTLIGDLGTSFFLHENVLKISKKNRHFSWKWVISPKMVFTYAGPLMWGPWCLPSVHLIRHC